MNSCNLVQVQVRLLYKGIIFKAEFANKFSKFVSYCEQNKYKK